MSQRVTDPPPEVKSGRVVLRPEVGSVVRGRVNGSSGVERVVFNEKMWETRRETFLTELKQRIRDIRQGPDGFIYLLTEETDGAVLKVEPAD